MSFSTQFSKGSSCEARQERLLDESALLPFVTQARSVCELGAGSGERARWLLAKLPQNTQYIGFEPADAFLRSSLVPVRKFDPALPLPLPTASQDLVCALDLPDALRMDQLYMLLSESRRVLKPGGRCLLRSLSYRRGKLGKIVGQLWNRLGRERKALDLNHYISPEDWTVESESFSGGPLLKLQTLVLTRLPEQSNVPGYPSPEDPLP